MDVTGPVRLEYDSESFAIDARTALEAEQPFLFTIRGAAWDQLRPHVVADGIPRWPTLTTLPKLQLLVVILALAAAHTARIRVQCSVDFAEVLVDEVGALHVAD